MCVPGDLRIVNIIGWNGVEVMSVPNGHADGNRSCVRRRHHVLLHRMDHVSRPFADVGYCGRIANQACRSMDFEYLLQSRRVLVRR